MCIMFWTATHVAQEYIELIALLPWLLFSIYYIISDSYLCSQQYKGNNGNVNAPQCYVVRTLPTLLGLMVIIQIIMRNVCIRGQSIKKKNFFCF